LTEALVDSEDDCEDDGDGDKLMLLLGLDDALLDNVTEIDCDELPLLLADCDDDGDGLAVSKVATGDFDNDCDGEDDNETDVDSDDESEVDTDALLDGNDETNIDDDKDELPLPLSELLPLADTEDDCDKLKLPLELTGALLNAGTLGEELEDKDNEVDDDGDEPPLPLAETDVDCEELLLPLVDEDALILLL
jgi:hypothetical protein